MAIAIDNSADLGNGTSPYSSSYTTNAANAKIIINILDGASSGQSVTVDGNSATLVGNSGVDSNGGNSVQFYYDCPSAGSHTIVATNGTITMVVQAVSYTGMATGNPEAVTSNFTNTHTPSITESVTTSTDKDWTVMTTFSQGQATASTGSHTVINSANGYGIFDSGADVTPAGSYSMTLNGPNNEWCWVMAAYKPAATTTSKTQTGVARITATTAQTQAGKSRITATSTQTQNGKARITVTTSQTQAGKGYIVTGTIKTQTGVANIRATTQKTQAGKASIAPITQQTQAGKASVKGSTAQLQTGVAKIVGYHPTVSSAAIALMLQFRQTTLTL